MELPRMHLADTTTALTSTTLVSFTGISLMWKITAAAMIVSLFFAVTRFIPRREV